MWLLRLGRYMGDFLKLLEFSEQQVPLTIFRLNNMLTEVNCPNDSIQELCKKLPYGLDDDVRITAKWLYKRGNISTRTIMKD